MLENYSKVVCLFRNVNIVLFSILLLLSANQLIFASGSRHQHLSHSERFSRAEGLMKEAISLARSNRHRESIPLLIQAIEYVPDNVPLWYNLGLSYFHSNDYENAEKAWLRTINMRQNHPDALYNLGLIYSRTNRSPEAIAVFSQSLEYRPEDSDALVSLINECARVSDNALRQLQKVAPDRAQALSQSGGGPSSLQGQHPLADQEIPGTGRTFDELLDIFKHTPFQQGR